MHLHCADRLRLRNEGSVRSVDALLLSYDGRNDIAITVGSLDEPALWVPASHYGVESRLVWADSGPGLPESPTRERS